MWTCKRSAYRNVEMKIFVKNIIFDEELSMVDAADEIVAIV